MYLWGEKFIFFGRICVHTKCMMPLLKSNWFYGTQKPIIFKNTTVFEETLTFVKVCHSFCNLDSCCITLVVKMKPKSEVYLKPC